MNIDDDRTLERLRRAQHLADEHAPPSGACPPAEQLFDLRIAGLSPEDAAAVTEHVAVCPACAEALRLAVALEPTLDPPLERPNDERPNDERPGSGRAWIFGGIALLAAGLATLLLGRPNSAVPPSFDNAPEVFRGAEDLEFQRLSPAVAAPDAFELAWSAGPEGTVYDVRVHDDELAVLHEVFEIEEPRVVVPASAIAERRGGSAVLWIVTVHLPDGRIRTLPTWATRVSTTAAGD